MRLLFENRLNCKDLLDTFQADADKHDKLLLVSVSTPVGEVMCPSAGTRPTMRPPSQLLRGLLWCVTHDPSRARLESESEQPPGPGGTQPGSQPFAPGTPSPPIVVVPDSDAEAPGRPLLRGDWDETVLQAWPP